GVGADTDTAMELLPIGKSEVLRSGSDITIIAVGAMVPAAVQAANRLHELGHDATVVNARFIKPLDDELILDLALSTNGIITIEENVVAGGYGSAVMELLAGHNCHTPVKPMGVPDAFLDQASQQRLRDIAGLNVDSIVTNALAILAHAAAPAPSVERAASD
ncbi:MAG: 1-deoxy-D-xylulose-5-phosphate synthase, partial [Thermomicrobiales bacterium]|nr:1-deoxy-D-xylulose-5-phosphate synthase [Thermomicrobiales bacterium]